MLCGHCSVGFWSLNSSRRNSIVGLNVGVGVGVGVGVHKLCDRQRRNAVNVNTNPLLSVMKKK